jgi:hypothetical protein
MKVIGLKNSTFSPDRYRAAFGPNHGDDLTTDDVLASVRALGESCGDGLREHLRASPLFIGERAE